MTGHVRPIRFTGSGVVLPDQTPLPAEGAYIGIRSADEMRLAIGRLAVGVAAAYGLCLGTAACVDGPRDAFDASLQKIAPLRYARAKRRL